jgi:hypothetical protein
MTERARDHRTTETLPEAGKVRFRLQVDDRDGDPCHRFAPGGPVEVWLIASEQPIDAAGVDGYKYVVLPLCFPNYPIARRHVERLNLLADALASALLEAQVDADAAIPTLDDGHRHVVTFARYSRRLPFQAECELCMATLVEDVGEWARIRGFVEPDKLSRTFTIEDAASVKGAIEQAVNRDG